MTAWASAQLLPDGPTTDTFGRVPVWHYEDVPGKAFWCEECQEHHAERIRVEDPSIPNAATWPVGTGDWKSYDKVRFVTDDGRVLTVPITGGALTLAPEDTLSIGTPGDGEWTTL